MIRYLNNLARLLLAPNTQDEGGGGGQQGGANDGGSGVAGVSTSSDAEAGGASDGGAGEEGAGTAEGEEEEEEGEEQAASSTEEIVASVLEKVLPAIQPKPQQQQQGQQFNQEEFDRAFNVWKPNGDLLTALRSEDPAVALKAFDQIRDGLIKQAMTMAEYRIQQVVKQMHDQHIAPVQEYVSTARAEALKGEFYTKHPDLKDYEAIVDSVAAGMEAKGVNFKGDKGKMFAETAKNARLVLKTLLAKKPNGEGQNQNQQQNRSQRMSAASAGGQSGGGGRAGGQSQSNLPAGVAAGLAVFD